MALRDQITEVISRYEWEHLSHAYGYCFAIPESLMQLGSQKSWAREGTRGHLYELILPQIVRSRSKTRVKAHRNR